MTQRFKFYEFFAGGGMARLGLGNRWECAFANDFDRVKATTYLANFPASKSHFKSGDVWALKPKDLPGQADLAWASSPCQDFSLAGERAGLKGGRSSAFFGFWALVQALGLEGRAPKTIVIENVVGLLSSHGGADFRKLCWSLSKEGYVFGALELDASRFVPQSRQRVFIVATKIKRLKNLTHVEPRKPFHSQKVVEAFNQLGADLQARWRWWKLGYPPEGDRPLDKYLDRDDDVDWFGQDEVDRLKDLLSDLHKKKLADAQAREERIVGTLFRRMRTEGKKKVQRAELRLDDCAGCLRTPRGGSSRQVVVVIHGNSVKARRLTPSEGARLMGLDNGYKLPKRSTAAFEVLGDGVVVPVVSFLRKRLLDPLAELGVEDVNEQEEGRRARA